jgi:tryptophan synthase beta subunit
MNKGRYGVHGGQYVPETLMNEILSLEGSMKGSGKIRGSRPSSMRC